MLRVLFWNRWRPLAALVACVIVIVVIARVASGGAHGHSPGGGHPSPQATASAAPAASLAGPGAAGATSPPSVSPLPAVTGPPPPAALTAATRFMSVWVSRGPGWVPRMRPYATAQLEAQLSHAGNAQGPATAVTGPAAVTSQAPGTVSLSVPTDAGPALVTVRLAGGRWLADAVILARTGD